MKCLGIFVVTYHAADWIPFSNYAVNIQVTVGHRKVAVIKRPISIACAELTRLIACPFLVLCGAIYRTSPHTLP